VNSNGTEDRAYGLVWSSIIEFARRF